MTANATPKEAMAPVLVAANVLPVLTLARSMSAASCTAIAPATVAVPAVSSVSSVSAPKVLLA